MLQRTPLTYALIAAITMLTQLSASDVSTSIDALHSDDFDARRSALNALGSQVAHASASDADPAQRLDLESTLLESISDSQTPELTRYYVMRLLPPIASDATVQAMLERVLADSSDAKLRSEASAVLAQIEGSSVTQSLTEALKGASDEARNEILSALAVRRDASQATLLVELLKSEAIPLDALVIQVLGTLEHSEVREFLFETWQAAEGEQQSQIATALLHTGMARANELRAIAQEGESALQVAALTQWLERDESAALDFLEDTLKSDPVHGDALLDQALKVGRNATWQRVISRTTPFSESALLVVLGAIQEQGRVELESWVLQQLEQESEAAQLAAVQALASVGGVNSTDALIERTRSANESLAAAAMNSLAVVHDPKLDARILDSAGNLSEPDHVRAIELLSIRNCEGAVELLNSLLAEKALAETTLDVLLPGLERVGNLQSVKLLLVKLVSAPDSPLVRDLQITLKRLVIRLEQPERLWERAFAPTLALELPAVLEARVLAILDGISAAEALEYCIERHRGNDAHLARSAEQALIRWRRVDVSDYWVTLLQESQSGSAEWQLAIRSLGMNLKSKTLANTEREVAMKSAELFLSCAVPEARQQILQAVEGLEGWHQQNFYRALHPGLSLQDFVELLAPFAP